VTGAAAAGLTKLTTQLSTQLSTEISEILTLQGAHGDAALLAALERAVAFNRWRAADVRSILASAGAAPTPRPPGQTLVLRLPTVPTRSLDAYRVDHGGCPGCGNWPRAPGHREDATVEARRAHRAMCAS
jgi:hypothetical protein